MPPKKISPRKKSDAADPSASSHRLDVLAGGQAVRHQMEAKLIKRKKREAALPTTETDTQRLSAVWSLRKTLGITYGRKSQK
jgi:hypothetical protein